MKKSYHPLLVFGIVTLVGCGNSTSGETTEESAGTPSVGGMDGSTNVPSTGGVPASGGIGALGGTMGSGGSPAAGGMTQTGSGGATGLGGSVGGMTASGGAVQTLVGGATSTGGGISAGGVTAMGGSPAIGGGTTLAGGMPAAGGSTMDIGGTVATSGGAEAGGTTANGGTTESGGTTENGGTQEAGGTTETGGTPSIGGMAPNPFVKFIGNLSPKNQDIPADFADKWMQVTMEANSKWGFVQPDSADDWVWEPVDQAHDYAVEHGLVFKQHCFFWNFEQPSWVNSSNVATAGPAWIKAFCDRYPDVAMIDVVNEPLHNKAPYRDGMGGDTDHAWVVQAFKWAREYCPNAILIINDFNIIEYDHDHESFVEALHTMLDAGAPIDAIGAQGHDVYKIGAEKSKTYIDNLVNEFNLPIYITEVDIDQSDDEEQRVSMEEEITMFWDHPAVYGITYWGFLQGSTWRPNAWLVDGSGNERPAMTWLQDFIRAHR